MSAPTEKPTRRRIGPKGANGARSVVEWPAELYEDVKRVALAKGMGTNTWIRQVMERAVRRFDRDGEAGDGE